MAALQDTNGVAPSQEPLGTLLVGRGLITPEQLEEALAEQKATGQPLGAVVVSRGYASPAIVAQALATQHGGLLKTEYGFATGFSEGMRPSMQIGEPPVSSVRIGKPVVEVPPSVAKPAGDREAVREELAMASVETERLAEANSRLTELRADLEQRLAQESQRAASLETALAEARAQVVAPAECGQQVAQLEATVAELHAGATAWQQAYNELEQRLSQTESARVELERALANAVDRGSSVRDELASAEESRIAAESWEAERVELAQRLAQVTERAEALQAEVETAKSLGSSSVELEERLQTASEQLNQAESVRSHLEQRLAEATKGAAELEAKVAAAEQLRKSAIAAEQARTELEAELEQRNEELEQLRAAAADPFATAEKHLLFFQGAGGYEIVERDGPPPSPGTRVDDHMVARVAVGAFPGDLPCAYLVD
jgi:predicted RNase H-like nuclease (RuvC/YqgF family)